MPRPSAPPSLLLDLYVANALAGQLVKQALAGHDLPAEDLPFYAVIGHEGPLTPTALATRMGMPLSTALFRVGRLIERGHAQRAPNPDDGRSYLVRLTPAGLDAWNATAAAFHPAARSVEDLLGAKAETVREAIAQLAAAIQHELAATAPSSR